MHNRKKTYQGLATKNRGYYLKREIKQFIESKLTI